MKKVKCDIKFEITLTEQDITLFKNMMDSGTGEKELLETISSAILKDFEKSFDYEDVSVTKIKSKFA